MFLMNKQQADIPVYVYVCITLCNTYYTIYVFKMHKKSNWQESPVTSDKYQRHVVTQTRYGLYTKLAQRWDSIYYLLHNSQQLFQVHFIQILKCHSLLLHSLLTLSTIFLFLWYPLILIRAINQPLIFADALYKNRWILISYLLWCENVARPNGYEQLGQKFPNQRIYLLMIIRLNMKIHVSSSNIILSLF